MLSSPLPCLASSRLFFLSLIGLTIVLMTSWLARKRLGRRDLHASVDPGRYQGFVHQLVLLPRSRSSPFVLFPCAAIRELRSPSQHQRSLQHLRLGPYGRYPCSVRATFFPQMSSSRSPPPLFPSPVPNSSKPSPLSLSHPIKPFSPIHRSTSPPRKNPLLLLPSRRPVSGRTTTAYGTILGR